MNSVLAPEIRKVTEVVQDFPAVSIIIPFDPKMSLKEDITNSLVGVKNKVELALLNSYPLDLISLVMNRLRSIFNNLNYATHKKSLAIYVSPVFEKVLYLDIDVEEKIVVSDVFEIRDLLFSKKQSQKYIVLLLSGKGIRLYLGNNNRHVKILSNTPRHVYTHVNEISPGTPKLFDKSTRQVVLLDKFLHQIDQDLDIILTAYQLPLFVLGMEKIIGYFKNISKHSGSVIEFIPAYCDEINETYMEELLQPYISNWKNVKQKNLMNLVRVAVGKNKLSIGLTDVFQDALNHKGQLLLVENNCRQSGKIGHPIKNVFKMRQVVDPYKNYSYIKDELDNVMEKVLENGGDVELVENGFLKDYQGIVLIKN